MRLILSFFIFTSTLASCARLALHNADANLRIVIEQEMVEPVYRFEVSQNFLKVYEIKRIASKNKPSKTKLFKVFSLKLKNEQIREINNFLEVLLSLNSRYEEPALGGIGWSISIDYEEKRKDIYLENTIIPEVLVFFEYINGLIPEGKPRIFIDPFSG